MQIQEKTLSNVEKIQITSQKSAQVFHERMGHVSNDSTRYTAKHFGVQLSGALDVCENCAIGKIRKKNLKQETDKVNKAKQPGERLYIDITSMKVANILGKRFWNLAVDEATNMCFSLFMQNKSDLAELFTKFLKVMKDTHKIQVKVIRCDNAGENKALQALCEAESLGVKFEYTATGTPQHNGVVERMFPTVLSRTRAILNKAGLTQKKRDQLWAEAAKTATKLTNITVKVNGQATPHKNFYGEEPEYSRYLRTWGEMGVVKDPTEHKLKNADRGRVCMFLGYASNHAGDSYKVFHLKTGKALISRDVRWLNKSFGEHQGLTGVIKEPSAFVPSEAAGYESGRESDQEQENPENDPEVQVEPETPTENQEIKQLPQTERYLQDNLILESRTRSGGITDTVGINIDDWMEEFCLINPVSSFTTQDEPTCFTDAWENPDPETRRKWQEAIRKEFSDMKKREVWEHVAKKSIPENRPLVGCKWVFKIKRDGTHRARLVALGYSQIPGVDFTENYAPVVNDVTFRMVLVIIMIKKLKTRLLDVETAFLHGKLEEEIYMKVPEGYHIEHKIGEGECFKLSQAIYGLVQAARLWWKHFVKVLKELEPPFIQSAADPCLLFRMDEGEICIIVLYVDDMHTSGTTRSLDKLENQIKKFFTLKVEKDPQDYLGCEMRFDSDLKNGWLGQPTIIKSLKSKFGNLTQKLKNYRTPGTPGFTVIRSELQDVIEDDLQKLYRTGVGTLLYLVKHSQPDIANPVRELTKATMVHWRELLRIIKFILDTEELGLKLKPETTKNGVWYVRALSDSDYATDKNTYLTGFVVYFMGVPVAWRSRGQKAVTLSTSEAELVACSEVVKEVKFVLQVLQSLKFNVKLPITVLVDNIGAIFMTENVTTSDRTKHIDVRYHIVREYVEEGIVKIIFVRSAENDADLWTKNVTGELYETHSKKVMWTKENIVEDTEAGRVLEVQHQSCVTSVSSASNSSE